MEQLSTLIPTITAGVAVVAIIVSVITQVTKELSFMTKVPTELEVIILSLILTPVAFVVYANVTEISLTWYLVLGSVIAGFFVAFICMFGWEKLTEIVKKFKNTDGENK